MATQDPTSGEPNGPRKDPARPREDIPPPASFDETIEFNGSADPANESTLVPDLNQTVEYDSLATTFPRRESETAPQADRSPAENDEFDKTAFNNELTVAEYEPQVVDLEQTPVSFDDVTIELDHPTSEGSAIHSNFDLEKTLANTEETIVEDRPETSKAIDKSTSATRIYRGKQMASDKTVADLAGRTKSNLDGSIMASADVDVTINPRELSEKDTIAWNQAVGDGGASKSNLPSQLSPAIERTFSDRQFEKLRICTVAETPSNSDLTVDFKLLKKLGQGGMGDVFLAHQASLDRRLALKLMRPIEGRKRAQLTQTGKLEEFEENRRQQFLSEAIVTSDLDHPNIVPIHEAGFSSNGDLFYAMKCVVGDPWSDKIKTFSKDENIDVLMKVCDAIACAHNRGVVHRDIKPQNVMLGGFGVVLVMDWGLALPTPQYEKAESILATSGLGGTPAFMAPEMAVGPIEKIGPASDIYLLGATLFLIITGQAPHQGRNVTECMNAVRNNEIREVPPEKQGELLEIARKAMASNPKDRYEKVEDFQQAIRDYRSHAESISLATGAFEYLENAKKSQSDSDFSRASFGFEEAIKSWSGNAKAHHGLAEAVLLRAQSAYEKGNYELGLSLLDENDAEHVATIAKIRAGMNEAHNRVIRLARLRKIAAAMLAFILVGGSVAFWITNQARRKAEDAAVSEMAQRKIADQKTEFANTQKSIAEEQTKIATAQEAKAKEQEAIAKQQTALAVEETRKAKAATEVAIQAKEGEAAERALAVKARDDAEKQKGIAERAKENAEAAEKIAKYEEYVSKIGLAKAKLQDNDVENASIILKEIRGSQAHDSWEWRWLWEQADQSTLGVKADSPLIDMSLSPSGSQGAIVLSNGQVYRLAFDGDGKVVSHTPVMDPALWNYRATSVAYSPLSDDVAIGTTSGDIVIVSLDGNARLLERAHEDRVTDLQFTRDGVLASGSADRTVRFWAAKTNSELTNEQACWHLSPVRQLAVSGTGSEITLAVATTEESTGTVTVWSVSTGSSFSARQQGVFTGHEHPVVCVTLSPDGKLAGSGDIAGNALLWNPSLLRPVDYSRSVANALSKVRGGVANRDARATVQPIRFARLIDSSDDNQQQLISTASTVPGEIGAATKLAHQDIVRSIQFSRDGESLLTSSDDNTLKLWGVNSRQLQRTMRGHGGWVIASNFLADTNDRIVSASNDATVRTWNPETYVNASINQSLKKVDSKDASRQAKAHENEIVSARFSTDGTKLITASGDRTARIFEIDPTTYAFREVARIDEEVLDEGTPYAAMSMHADPQNGRLFIGSADSTIRIWDLARGVELSQADGTGINNTFAVSLDGKRMLTGSSEPNEKLVLWELDPMGVIPPRPAHRMTEHDEAVTAMAISPDSKMLFSGDRGGYGILWDAATGKRIGDAVETVRGFRVNAAQFSRDNRSLFIASDDEQLTQIDVRNKKVTARMNHNGFVSRLALSDDGNWAATVSELLTKTTLRTAATLWNLQTGKASVLDEIELAIDADQPLTARDRQRVLAVQFDKASATVVVSRTGSKQRGGVIRTVDLSSMKSTMHELPAQLGNADAIVPLDASTLITMNTNGAFKWDLANEKLSLSYRSHAKLTQATFSWDGAYVATSSRSVKIWDAANGRALAKLEAPHIGPVRSVVMAPSNTHGASKYLFATAGDDSVVRTWIFNTESNVITPVDELRADDNKEQINRICFSPNSMQLLAVGNNGSVSVHTLDGSSPTKQYNVDGAGDFVSAAFSGDGKVIAAGSTDNKVRIWSLVPTEPNQPAQPAWVELIGNAGKVNDIAFDGTVATGLRVITASASDAKLWDPRISDRGMLTVTEGREILSLRGHKGDVTAVDVANNGQLLMTASNDGTVILWPAKTQPRPEPPNLFDNL